MTSFDGFDIIQLILMTHTKDRNVKEMHHFFLQFYRNVKEMHQFILPFYRNMLGMHHLSAFQRAECLLLTCSILIVVLLL